MMSEKGGFYVWKSKVLNVTTSTKYGEIIWANVIVCSIFHVIAVASLYCLPYAKWQTVLLAVVTYVLSGFGITAGAHRLWGHRSYKARLPLRILLVAFNTLAIQRDLRWWCRDHRTHHKFVDTNADPYTATRGFVFSHIGWFMMKKHSDVIKQGSKVDISDLEADPIIMFQKRYYDRLVIWFALILPTVVPVYLWNENPYLAFGFVILRFLYTLHCTFAVNSFAHLWGDQPYDKSFTPKQNPFVSLFALGEGYHNFHHSFPSDYATSELGLKLNPSKYFILLMSYLGQAYDLKTVSPELVKKRALRTG